MTINDQAENDWDFNTFSVFGGVNRALCIGYNDATSESNFEWVSGESSTFVNFAPGQPDNGNSGGVTENYVHFLWPTHSEAGTWNDFQNINGVNGFATNGVVEIAAVPVPIAFWFLISGLVALLPRYKIV